jgi:hypothetical protein
VESIRNDLKEASFDIDNVWTTARVLHSLEVKYKNGQEGALLQPS